MKAIFNRISKDIQEGWRETPNSVKFWNAIFVLVIIITGIILPEALIVIFVVGSLITIGLFLDQENIDKHLWIWFMPITWLFAIVAITIGCFYLLYENSIAKFNDWLDKKPE